MNSRIFVLSFFSLVAKAQTLCPDLHGWIGKPSSEIPAALSANGELEFVAQKDRVVKASCTPKVPKGLANYIVKKRKVVELVIPMVGDAHDGSRRFVDPATYETWLIDRKGYLMRYEAWGSYRIPHDEPIAWEEILMRAPKYGEDVRVQEHEN